MCSLQSLDSLLGCFSRFAQIVMERKDNVIFFLAQSKCLSNLFIETLSFLGQILPGQAFVESALVNRF